jgi:hypothetical protein
MLPYLSGLTVALVEYGCVRMPAALLTMYWPIT